MTACAQKKQGGQIVTAPTDQGASALLAARVGAYFEVYRVDETQVSAMRWLGGEWRWRLRMDDGETLALSCQYATSDACLAAVHALRNCAHAADIIIAGSPHGVTA